jgi:hypothetical protein
MPTKTAEGRRRRLNCCTRRALWTKQRRRLLVFNDFFMAVYLVGVAAGLR